MSHSEINVLRTVPDPEVITYITDTPGVNKHESKEEQFVSVEDAEKGAFARKSTLSQLEFESTQVGHRLIL